MPNADDITFDPQLEGLTRWAIDKAESATDPIWRGAMMNLAMAANHLDVLFRDGSLTPSLRADKQGSAIPFPREPQDATKAERA